MTTLRDLLEIRWDNRAAIDAIPGLLGTALGFKNGDPGTPSVLVFVERKIHDRWLPLSAVVPPVLTDAVQRRSCPTDVIEVGRELDAPYPPPRLADDQLLVRAGLRGAADRLQPGSQISFRDLHGVGSSGTLTCFARSRDGGRPGLLTNAHVGIFPGNALTHPDLDSPKIGAMARVSVTVGEKTRFPGAPATPGSLAIVDAGYAPLDVAPGDIDVQLTFWADDGPARAPLGAPWRLDLDHEHLAPIGLAVYGVGRSRSMQFGRIQAFAFEQRYGAHLRTCIDYLIVSNTDDDSGYFSAPGDSGKLVVTENGLNPIAVVWGGASWSTNARRELVDHTFATDISVFLDAVSADIMS